MDHMYIRHAVGSRLLWDSLKNNCGFEVELIDGCWRFIIEVTDAILAEQVLSNRNELNIFVVAENKPNHKSWYYSSKGLVDYDPTANKITIFADVLTNYVV
jgi:hypothetical protein